MRDKQAFEAYVLEKSRAQQQKMQIRRKRILATGMSLCVCVIALVGFSALQGQWNNHTEPLPVSTSPAQNGGSVEEEAVGGNGGMHGIDSSQNTPKPTVLAPTKIPTASPERTPQASLLPNIPKYTAPVVAPSEALPLDQAFAQGKTDYAIPDRINEMTEVATICQICDWVMNGNFTAGTQPEKVDCTMTIYYGQDSITCYLAESGFFKMGEGAWLKTDPTYMVRLMDILEGN